MNYSCDTCGKALTSEKREAISKAYCATCFIETMMQIVAKIQTCKINCAGCSTVLTDYEIECSVVVEVEMRRDPEKRAAMDAQQAKGQFGFAHMCDACLEIEEKWSKFEEQQAAAEIDRQHRYHY